MNETLDESNTGCLQRLADICGIVGDYYDIWGNHRITSGDTQYRLLRAMRIIEDNEEPCEALTRLQGQAQQPSVQVVVAGQAIKVSVTLAESAGHDVLSWQILKRSSRAGRTGVIPFSFGIRSFRTISTLCSSFFRGLAWRTWKNII